jgi:lysophospholipase L1-like esterase
MRAHKVNKKTLANVAEAGKSVDVAFIGDSITEEWNGRWAGRNMTRLAPIAQTFDKYFHKDSGADYEGVALGINGDHSPHLLWRLQHGEMPDSFNPQVWWILMGTNDLTSGGCSPEVVLLGILRLVEEIQYRKPYATVVINGILPSAVPAVKRDKKYMNRPGMGGKFRGKKGAPFKNNKKGGDGDASVEDVETEQLPNKKPFFRGYTEVKDLRPTIKIINAQLKKFATNHDNVHYYDFTDVFVKNDEQHGGNKRIIDEKMLSGVHPTAAGHKEWAKKIVSKLKELLPANGALDYIPDSKQDGIDPED